MYQCSIGFMKHLLTTIRDWQPGITMALISFIYDAGRKRMREVYIQWKLSVVDTLGTAEGVLIREVSLSQGCSYRGVYM